MTFDETSALFGLTPQVRRLSEGLSTQDLSRQAALPPMFGLLGAGVVAQRLRASSSWAG